MFCFRKKIIGKQNSKIIFLLCGWFGKIWHYYPTALILAHHGYRSEIYEFDDKILSSSVSETIHNTNLVKEEILKRIKQCRSDSISDFSIFGTSYGTNVAFMVANAEKKIKNIVINLSSVDLAKTVWTWDRGHGSEVKKGIIEQKISLAVLKEKWALLSPINNINNLKDRNILYYMARKDEIIPYKLQIQLLQKLKQKTVKINILENRHNNHLFTALINLLRYNTYIDFLTGR